MSTNSPRLLLAAEMAVAGLLSFLSVVSPPFRAFIQEYVWKPDTTYYYLNLLVVVERVAAAYAANTPWRSAVREIVGWLSGYTLVLFFIHGFQAEGDSMIALKLLLFIPVGIHLRLLVRALGRINWVAPDSASLMDARLSQRIDEGQNQNQNQSS